MAERQRAARRSVAGPGGAAARADTENLVQLLGGKRAITHCNRTEDLRVQLDLIERDPIGDAKIEMLAHRAHLHCQADSRKPYHKATTRPYAPA